MGSKEAVKVERTALMPQKGQEGEREMEERKQQWEIEKKYIEKKMQKMKGNMRD